MNGGEIALIVVFGASLLIAAHVHGKPRDDYNFWCIGVSLAIEFALMWWAGLFH